MLRQQVRQAVVAELAATLLREDGRGRVDAEFVEPGPQRRCGVLPKRSAALLASLALAVHMGTRPEMDILAPQPEQFRAQPAARSAAPRAAGCGRGALLASACPGSPARTRLRRRRGSPPEAECSVFSGWLRKAPRNGVSNSASCKFVGGCRNSRWAWRTSRRKVSRQLAIVCGLAWRCCIRRSVEKAASSRARSATSFMRGASARSAPDAG